MYSASLLSLEVKVKVWKVSGGTCETVLDQFTGSEVVFRAVKNAALLTLSIQTNCCKHVIRLD